MYDIKFRIDKFANYAVRYASGTFYFFNDEGIYSSTKDPSKLKNIHINGDNKYSISYSIAVNRFLNINRFRKAIVRLPLGSTLEEFEKLYKTTQIEKHSLSELDQFITKIDKPSIERATGNSNLNTFDFVKVDAFFVTTHPNPKEFIRQNFKGILNNVGKKIAENKLFQKYGISINFLKLTQYIVDMKLHRIHFIFELKEI